MDWLFYMDVDAELTCTVCGEPNHHGYLLVIDPTCKQIEFRSFVCHPCAETIADVVRDDWKITGSKKELCGLDICTAQKK